MDKKICIVDYNAGNVKSLFHSIKKICNHEVIVSNELAVIKNADYIVLPGVGSYSYVSNYLSVRKLDITLKSAMIESHKPILGICLGMQILFDSSTEFGYSKGLSILSGTVDELDNNSNFPLPNIGWRYVEMSNSINTPFESGWFYFAHSYCVKNIDPKNIIATSKYLNNFPSIVNHNNFYGVQFHPEKSSKNGLDFLNTFFKL